MTHAIAVLRFEHKNLAKLLGLMENQLRGLTQGAAPNHGLLRSISEYLRGYPDQCHHPKEDLIYRRMAARDPLTTSKLADLEDEHRKLHALTRDFADQVEEIGTVSGKTVDKLTEATRRLIDSYRHHMKFEESHFFPRALEVLSQDDWTEVNYAVSEQDDPLFDEAMTNFHALRTEIFRQADELAENAAAPGAAQELSEITSLASFNEKMQTLKLSIVLGRNAKGNYRLNEGKALLLEIPDCSEEQAAWAAYCYLQGRQA